MALDVRRRPLPVPRSRVPAAAALPGFPVSVSTPGPRVGRAGTALSGLLSVAVHYRPPRALRPRRFDSGDDLGHLGAIDCRHDGLHAGGAAHSPARRWLCGAAAAGPDDFGVPIPGGRRTSGVRRTRTLDAALLHARRERLSLLDPASGSGGS